MHDSVLRWTAQQVDRHHLNRPGQAVLEVGSQNVNGTVRTLFDQTDYTGCDMQAGPGVDVVCDAHDLTRRFRRRFDVVVSTEMLEHDRCFWRSCEQMGAVLKVGGWLLLTARGVNRRNEAMPEHSYPDDYWRFMPSSFAVLFDVAGCTVVDIAEDPELPGWFGIARK